MKQLIKRHDDAVTALEEIYKLEQEYREQGYIVKRLMNCIQLVLDDGCVEIWWEDGAIWQEVVEGNPAE